MIEDTMHVIQDSTPENRLESRVAIPGLSLAVRPDTFFSSRRYLRCILLDVNRGGIAFTSKVLALNTEQKVRLCFECDGKVEEALGVVRSVESLAGETRYGVVFTDVPVELDRLIDRFLP